MARPKGLPKTGGRQKGVANKATASIRDIAQQYTTEALEALLGVLRSDEAPHAAKVGAAKEILDRGHGKATQPISGDKDMAPVRIDLSAWDDDMLSKVAATVIEGD